MIAVGGEDLPDQNKRNSVRVVIEELVKSGVQPQDIASLLPARRMLELPGTPTTRDAVAQALTDLGVTHPERYLLEHPVRVNDQCWMITRAWGAQTETYLARLQNTFPNSHITFRKADE